MSLIILAGIITLLFVAFGGYFGWFGALWKGYAPGGAIGLLVLILIFDLVMGGI
jgi:hypothetical protein